jgi:hypothetical protein
MPKTLFERMSEAQSEANTPPVVTEASEVAWRWRFVYPRGPGQWYVRQTPIEPSAGGGGFAAIEVEPLYRITTTEALIAENARQQNRADQQAEWAIREAEKAVALEAKLEAAKAAIKDAYREGFTDADEGQGTEDELYREFEACWKISRAKAALETSHGE